MTRESGNARRWCRDYAMRHRLVSNKVRARTRRHPPLPLPRDMLYSAIYHIPQRRIHRGDFATRNSLRVFLPPPYSPVPPCSDRRKRKKKKKRNPQLTVRNRNPSVSLCTPKSVGLALLAFAKMEFLILFSPLLPSPRYTLVFVLRYKTRTQKKETRPSFRKCSAKCRDKTGRNTG